MCTCVFFALFPDPPVVFWCGVIPVIVSFQHQTMRVHRSSPLTWVRLLPSGGSGLVLKKCQLGKSLEAQEFSSGGKFRIPWWKLLFPTIYPVVTFNFILKDKRKMLLPVIGYCEPGMKNPFAKIFKNGKITLAVVKSTWTQTASIKVFLGMPLCTWKKTSAEVSGLVLKDHGTMHHAFGAINK